MADTQTFRERVPIVAKMVDKAFNGDATKNSEVVEFIMVASKLDGDARRVVSISNCTDVQSAMSLLLMSIAELPKRAPLMEGEEEAGPVGHA